MKLIVITQEEEEDAACGAVMHIKLAKYRLLKSLVGSDKNESLI